MLSSIKYLKLLYTMNMEEIYKILKKEINKNRHQPILILCIGSPHVIGDSLGPYVGEKLSKAKLENKVLIKGNLKKPIHYLNIKEVLKGAECKDLNPYIIIVDASLYNQSNVGKIMITKNKFVLGEALNKNQYKVGNIGIKGIVGENKKDALKNFQILKNVSDLLIQDMSKQIAHQIYKAIAE